jgi:hypothetical protein
MRAGTNLSFFAQQPGAAAKALHLAPDSWQSVPISCRESGMP